MLSATMYWHMSFWRIVEQITLRILVVIIILHAGLTLVRLFDKGPREASDVFLVAFLVLALLLAIAQGRALSRSKPWSAERWFTTFWGTGILDEVPAFSRWIMPVLIIGLVTSIVRLEWSAATILFALLVYHRLGRRSQISQGK